jgi:predicted nucleic acid-binding Zn ribbon protein
VESIKLSLSVKSCLQAGNRRFHQQAPESMPTYVYEIIGAGGEAGKRFEWIQSMRDAPLTRHPETGEPVRRVLQAPNLASRYSERQTKARLDNRQVEKAGFTKYEKDKLTGRYHRVAGRQGPSTIERPQ